MYKSLVVAAMIAAASAVKINVNAPPVTNTCVNVSKILGVEQSCSEPGNSAWNTHTTARTGDPRNATAGVYPDHALH